MKRIYTLFTLLFSFAYYLPGVAQTLTITGPGSSNSYLYSPIHSFNAAPRTVRIAYHYPASQIALGMMPNGATITSIAFERASGTTNALAGNPNLKIYLENLPSASTDFGAGSVAWATQTASATLVYDGDPTAIVGNGPGWKDFAFGTGAGAASSFTYTGGAIAVYAEYIQTTAQTSTITWLYESATNGTPSPNGWTSNSVKYSSSSTTTPATSMASSTSNHVHTQFSFNTGPCSGAPNPGNTIASASTVCSGVNFTLSMQNFLTNSGISYQWQSSPDGSIFTDIPGATNTTLTTSQTSSTYYSCLATCANGGASASSVPVQVVVPPGFSGTYTIDNTQPTGGTNFHSFTEAIAAMGCSISGPVVFNVVSGTPYNEQVIIPDLPGTSVTNTITINGNGAVLNYESSVSAERAVIKLNGIDYVTINDLTISSLAGTYGYGIQMLNDADHNTINGCTININQSSTSTNAFAGIVINSSATSVIGTGSSLCDNNTITNNTINGGYAGISIAANGSTSSVSDNVVTGNTVKDFYEYGIFINGNMNALVENNDISRPNRSAVTTFRGIGFSGVSMNCKVSKNKLHNPFGGAPASTSAGFCIYFTGCDATAGNENIVSNNIMYDHIGSTGNHNGVLNVSSDYVKYYHNTIFLNDASATCSSCAARGFYVQTPPVTGLEYKNNNVAIIHGGTSPKQCIYFEGTGNVTYVSDHNNFYIGSTSGATNQIGYDNGTGYNLLADWQTGTTQDAASISVDPIFQSVATGDLTPQGNMDNQGVFVGITDDILNAARSTTTPDIGAYEFTALGCTGTPVAGTATGPTNACDGADVFLSLTGFSTGSGINIQWESAPLGSGSWSPIAGATTSSYTASGFSASTDYHAIVTCANGGGNDVSNTVSVTLNPFYICYCTPVITSTGAAITNVNIPGTTLDNTSGAAANPYYVQYPDTGSATATLVQGGSYSINLTLAASGISSMWIDYDHNGIFDASEWIQVGTTGTSHSAIFAVPVSAMTGLTGMRVRTRTSGTNGSGNPCTSMTTAEAEDYIINIDPLVGCTGLPAPGTASGPGYTQCAPAAVDLSLVGYSVTTGVTLQWQYYDNGTSSWLPIAGATDPYYTVQNVNETTDYRAAVTCNNPGGGTDYSNIVTASVNNPQLLSTTPASRCGTGTVDLQATASPGSTVKWYDMPVGGSVVGSGNTFTTPVITNTTTYYAAANSGGTTVNTARPAPLSTANTNLTTYAMDFTITQTVTLNTVDVYSVTGTSITVSLYSAGGASQLFTTGATTVPTNTTNVINLGWTLQPGTYRLAANGMTGNFVRESSGATYPIALSTVGQINGYVSSITGTVSTGAAYYWFYNWSITTGCETARSAVDATVIPAPAVTVTAIPDTICLGGSSTLSAASANAYVYTWNPGSMSGSSQTVSPTANTDYYLAAADGSGCTFYDTVSVAVATVSPTVATIATPSEICISGNVALTLNPAPAFGITYQWQKNTGSGFTDIPGATDANYTETISTGTQYQAKMFCSGNLVNTSTPVNVIVNNPSLIATFPGSRCDAGPVTLVATAANGATLNWYTSATGGAPVATGGAYTTPSITTTTDYYVAASSGGGIYNTGLSVPPASPSSGSGTTNFGIVFDALAPFTLNSVVIYPVSATGASGTVTIDLINSSGTIVNQAVVNVVGAPSSSPSPQTVNLNFNIAPGTNYKLRPGSYTGISGLLFGPSASAPSGGNYGYPFTIPGTLSINASTLTAAPTNTPRLDLYYYFFNWQVSTSCESARVPVTASINGASSGTGLAAGGTTVGTLQADGTTIDYLDGCNDKVATVVDGAGGNTMGVTSAVVLTSSTVQTVNGVPYVPRVFDVTPASSGSATITIYALQSEFNAYNSYVTTNNLSYPLLPTGPADVTGMANIVVTQYHGSAGAGTTGPAGLYDASQQEFIPNSSINVTWTGNYWAMTFPVSGFSGFFIHSGNNPLLAIKLDQITATNAGSRNRIDWRTASEDDLDYFTVERSTDAKHFVVLGEVNASGEASSYSYWDETPASGVNYYRLKMNSHGNYTYSKVVSATVKANGIFMVEAFPNPVADRVTVKIHGTVGEHAMLLITDVMGKTVKVIAVNQPDNLIDMSGWAQGVYVIKYTDDLHSQQLKVNKL